MKIKYKITGAFGLLEEGKIINAYLLNIDEDSGIGLCYHPPKNGCGSFEFVKRKSNIKDYWISAFGDNCYVNIGDIDKKFKKFLKKLHE